MAEIKVTCAERIEKVTGIRPRIDLKDEVSIADLLARGEGKPE